MGSREGTAPWKVHKGEQKKLANQAGRSGGAPRSVEAWKTVHQKTEPFGSAWGWQNREEEGAQGAAPGLGGGACKNCESKGRVSTERGGRKEGNQGDAASQSLLQQGGGSSVMSTGRSRRSHRLRWGNSNSEGQSPSGPFVLIHHIHILLLRLVLPRVKRFSSHTCALGVCTCSPPWSLAPRLLRMEKTLADGLLSGQTRGMGAKGPDAHVGQSGIPASKGVHL